VYPQSLRSFAPRSDGWVQERGRFGVSLLGLQPLSSYLSKVVTLVLRDDSVQLVLTRNDRQHVIATSLQLDSLPSDDRVRLVLQRDDRLHDVAGFWELGTAHGLVVSRRRTSVRFEFRESGRQIAGGPARLAICSQTLGHLFVYEGRSQPLVNRLPEQL